MAEIARYFLRETYSHAVAACPQPSDTHRGCSGSPLTCVYLTSRRGCPSHSFLYGITGVMPQSSEMNTEMRGCKTRG